jgi:hypothetical protein
MFHYFLRVCSDYFLFIMGNMFSLFKLPHTITHLHVNSTVDTRDTKIKVTILQLMQTDKSKQICWSYSMIVIHTSLQSLFFSNFVKLMRVGAKLHK